ncbi:polysaccharide pyruvyl transferase family protein [Kitasatospora sp. NPDC097691]|uniref:polysaccharide pyruvyl transferase family protein n=1 Tax=Kitasatospora sp. NPDC097691 TaxID=3157231 RepID=UPI00332DDF42
MTSARGGDPVRGGGGAPVRGGASGTPVRVGLFGLLGSGNLGNDGSLEAVLGYLRAEHPDAVVDALCGGPEAVTTRFGIPATRLHWNRAEYRTASRAGAIAAKGLGKLVDAVRTAAWVRRHDVVIVPGMGVLEATLPLRPWGFPYALFLLCASGRLLGTRVALVSVGAAEIGNRPTRALVRWSARLAAYRSYRDGPSRDAMRAMGVDTSRDEVYPDLAFSLPAPPASEPAASSESTPSRPRGPVCLGVMDFHGGNDDRARADEIHRRYLDGTIRFVRTLVEEDRPVRLLTGDQCDTAVVAAILHAVDSPLVTAAEPASLADLMKEMAAADTVVAVRYHNLICALKTGTPVLALCYATKSEALMAEMGLGAYCHPAREVDADRLIEQFRALEQRSAELRRTLVERNVTAARRGRHQFAALTAALFPAADRARADVHTQTDVHTDAHDLRETQ